MKQILVFGHKNPDTDSICSAISFAELKNTQGVNVIPCRLGNVSKETQFALNHFGAEAPLFIENVNADENGKKEVILVDHNEKAQTADGIGRRGVHCRPALGRGLWQRTYRGCG